MRKLLFGLVFALGASSANAAGLYLSAGYSQGKPDLSVGDHVLPASSDMNINNPKLPQNVMGWPGGGTLAYYDPTEKLGVQAWSWSDGAIGSMQYNINDSNSMSVAVGWDISQNPFRFELEYQKTKFKFSSYNWNIRPPAGDVVGYIIGTYMGDQAVAGQGNSWHCQDTGVCLEYITSTGDYYGIPVDSYDFYIENEGGSDIELNVDTYMANVYFEIPGLGAIDPYVGIGYGRAKADFSENYSNAWQFMAGVEYRFLGTPFIVGAEYRQVKIDFDDVDLPGVKDTFDHKYVMFKLRYDFISDSI